MPPPKQERLRNSRREEFAARGSGVGCAFLGRLSFVTPGLQVSPKTNSGRLEGQADRKACLALSFSWPVAS